MTDGPRDFVCYLEIDKSTKVHKVDRSFGKLDDMLSYVGGLFGLLMSAIVFLFADYNEYNYELLIAEGAMQVEPESR